jgi:hypothetical protein
VAFASGTDGWIRCVEANLCGGPAGIEREGADAFGGNSRRTSAGSEKSTNGRVRPTAESGFAAVRRPEKRFLRSEAAAKGGIAQSFNRPMNDRGMEVA